MTAPRPLSVADVLDGMVDLLVAQWRAYVLILGPVVLPLSIVMAWLQTEVYGGAGLWQQLSDPAVADRLFAGGPDAATFAAAGALSVFSTVFISPLLYGAACRIAADGYQSTERPLRAVLDATLRRYPSLVGVTLLVLGAVTALLAVPVVLIVLGAVQEAAPLVGVGVVTLLLALPAAVAAAVLASLVYPCVVVEQAGPVAAVRRSYRLVRRRFWWVAGLLLLGTLIATLISQIVALPFGIPGDIWGAWVGVVLASVGAAVSSLLLTPLIAALLTLVYFDGRVRKEGYDLELMIRDVAAEQALG